MVNRSSTEEKHADRPIIENKEEKKDRHGNQHIHYQVKCCYFIISMSTNVIRYRLNQVQSNSSRCANIRQKQQNRDNHCHVRLLYQLTSIL